MGTCWRQCFDLLVRWPFSPQKEQTFWWEPLVRFLFAVDVWEALADCIEDASREGNADMTASDAVDASECEIVAPEATLRGGAVIVWGCEFILEGAVPLADALAWVSDCLDAFPATVLRVWWTLSELSSGEGTEKGRTFGTVDCRDANIEWVTSAAICSADSELPRITASTAKERVVSSEPKILGLGNKQQRENRARHTPRQTLTLSGCEIYAGPRRAVLVTCPVLRHHGP